MEEKEQQIEYGLSRGGVRLSTKNPHHKGKRANGRKSGEKCLDRGISVDIDNHAGSGEG